MTDEILKTVGVLEFKSIEKKETNELAASVKKAKKFMAETEKIAKKNAKYTKGFDSVKVLREIRYNKE